MGFTEAEAEEAATDRTAVPRGRLTAILRDATAVIRSGWSHWAPALTASNHVTHANDPDAIAFDPLNALERVCGDQDLVNAALCFLDGCTPGGSVTSWNDVPTRTHGEVVQLFVRAWQRAARLQGVS